MTRLATTPAILGILFGGMVAAGLLAGCSSKQVEIGSQNMDAHALDAPAGSGGAGAGTDAAVAGRGDATGGVTGAGGVGPGGGTVGSGAGGTAGVGGTAGTGGASSTGKTCGGFAGLPCAAGEICETPPGHCCCDYSGTCAVRPQVCAMIYQPVCGCDGTTYSNDCERQLAGVSKDFDGACPTVDAGTGGSTRSGGATGAGGATGTGGSTRTGGTTGTSTGCAPDWTLCCGQCLSPFAGVCLTPCPPAGGAGGTGGSTGAGGSTGTGKTCGGIAGVICPAGQFCDLQADSCNVADATGTCVANAGLGCITIYQPVCGCDGKTYPSDCDRQVAGVSKKSDGVCAAGVCPVGQSWCGPGCGTGTGYCSTFCSTRPCVAPDAGVGDAASGSCGQVTTQAECDSRSDCHSVFMDLGTCGCAAAGCCEHFNRCADGGRANCNPPVQFGCTIGQPSCGGAYVMSYTSNCYEGCVLQSECAGADGGVGGTAACQQVGTLDQSCIVDSDCLAVRHTTNCCGTSVWLGINKAGGQEFSTLESLCDASYPACGCATGSPTTSDGSSIPFGANAAVTCQGGVCKTYASACGHLCQTGRSCVTCGQADAGVSFCSLRCPSGTGCTEAAYSKCISSFNGGVCVAPDLPCSGF